MDAFSKQNPNLQLVWDASSLKSFQFCPRHYQLNNLQGWQNASVDLAFGRLIASALERYQKMRLGGTAKQDALLATVKWAMFETYVDGVGQWGGHYEDMWKCEGTEKYRNENSRVAKCPWSFKRVMFPGPQPEICSSCGSKTISMRMYCPDDDKKNRHTLISSIIAYADSQPDDIKEGLYPYTFEDGTPAVELSGKMPLPLQSQGGEPFVLSWNFDYIGVWGDDEKFIVDNKTTTKALDDKFFRSYAIDTQFDTYDLIGSIAYPTVGINGTMVDAIQVTATGVNLGRRPFYKNEAQREEHLHDLTWWIRQAEQMALLGYWPMNKRNCWLCPFNTVCSQPPSQREGFLKANFERGERWNPAKER
jgi:hypothetical protein